MVIASTTPLMKDNDIRQMLDTELRKQYANEPDTIVRHEMGLVYFRRRIDIAVLNGEFTGFEIKSDVDSLSRLPGQAELYGKVLDRVTLVTTDHHCKKAKELLPRWWGIAIAKRLKRPKGVIKLEQVRRARLNSGIDTKELLHMLWKAEIVKELRNRGLAEGKYNHGKWYLTEYLADALSLEEARNTARERLKGRLALSVALQCEQSDERHPISAIQ